MPDLVGTVASIYLGLVKSVEGTEQVGGELGFGGLLNNRKWVVWAPGTEMVITAKLTQGVPLLGCLAFRCAQGTEWISFPNGEYLTCGSRQADVALSKLLGLEVRLIRPGREMCQLKTNFGFDLKPGMGEDSSPVQFITTASFDALGLPLVQGIRRFRPTFVIDTAGVTGFVLDGWTARQVQVGDSCRLYDRKPTLRCPLPAQAHGELPEVPQLLRALRRVLPDNETPRMYLGRSAVVLDPGMIQVGDPVYLL